MQVDSGDFAETSTSTTSTTSTTRTNLSPALSSLTSTPRPLLSDTLGTSTATASSLSLSFTPAPLEPLRPTQLPIAAQGDFRWSLKGWRTQLQEALQAQGAEAKILSPEFDIGGETWQVLLKFTEDSSWLGMFLALAHPEKKATPDWAVCVEFSLAIELPAQEAAPERTGFGQHSFHRLDADTSDWGFNHFIYLSDLNEHLGDDLDLSACVRVLQDVSGGLWLSFDNYDSKRVIGYVGLENQGATCYMNSFLQSLFLTNSLRAAVYRIPTKDQVSGKSIPLALQRIFYQLQTSREPPHTNELTRSFGWDMAESFQQHDVQEFSRVLLDALETAMKGTRVEGTVEKLFRGRLRNVIRCVNVDYESSRSESFYDLQMTVRGVRGLQDSFDQYVSVEKMNGKNQYRTEKYGLQDAEKFVVFEHLPPVLHVHLERYAYNQYTGNIEKLHARFEFPPELDLSQYLASDSEQRPDDQHYWLHSILVHAGTSGGGHYYVYIRHPSNPDRWFKFDDTSVTPCTQFYAVNENFGNPAANEETDRTASADPADAYRSTGYRPSRLRKWTSAYMLVYLRKSDMAETMAPVDESALPAELLERFDVDAEADRRRRYEKMTMNVNVVTDEMVARHTGSDLFDPDGADAEAGLIRVPKDSTLSCLIPTDGQSYEIYGITPRRNKTLRPDVPMDLTDPRALMSLSNRLLSANNRHAFYLRTINPDSSDDLWRRPLVPAQRHILVYVKWFEDQSEHPDGVLLPLGSVAVDRESAIDSLAESVLVRLGLAEKTPLIFYEELKPGKITVLAPSASFAASNLRQGDIIIVGREAANKTPIEYFARLNSWVSAALRPLDGSKTGLPATISTLWKLPQLVAFVADKVDIAEADRPRLRLGFMRHDDANAKPSNANIHFWKYVQEAESTIADLLRAVIPENQPQVPSTPAVTIGWELTPVPVVDAERNLVRCWVEAGLGLPASVAAALPRTVYLPRYSASMTQLLTGLFEGTDIAPAELAGLRLLECHDGKIKRAYMPNTASELISHIMLDSASLYLEAAAPDEAPADKLISVFCYERATARPHSVPTKFAVKADEPVGAMRGRLALRLGLPSLDRVSLVLCSWTREQPLADEQECLTRLCLVTEVEQLAVQINDPVLAARRAAASDGSIRIRKAT